MTRPARCRAGRAPWPSSSALRGAVLTECRLQYEDIAGVPFEERWAVSHLSAARALQRQDFAAREALRNASRAAVWNIVAEVMHGPAPTACAESLMAVTVAAFAGALRGRGRPAIARLPLHNGLRSYVLWRFGGELLVRAGAVDLRNVFSKTRRLTDHELAVLKLLIEADDIRTPSAAVTDGITVGTFIDRERRAIAQARQHHGMKFGAVDRIRALEGARGGERVLVP